MRGTFIRLAVVMVAVVPLLALSGTAFAQYPPTGDGTTPDGSFACEGVTAGGTATCSIGGWQSGSEVSVDVTADETAVYADSVTADGSGFVSYSFQVPEGADDLTFAHAGVLADGSPAVHTAVLDATAPAGDGGAAAPDAEDGLPSTGEMILLLLVVGVLAVGIGVVAVRRGRTKADTPAGV